MKRFPTPVLERSVMQSGIKWLEGLGTGKTCKQFEAENWNSVIIMQIWATNLSSWLLM
jgi:hypothetical protein